ncbi:MAG: flagellar basal body rod protein FlgC [Anaerolinea sp.]|nr:flagellar basal body rod protein FlgC [Anaerolinea sp.]
MSVFDTLRIASSGLTAQRLRMDIAASNLANAQTTRTVAGGPYRAERVVFGPVQVGSSPSATGVRGMAIVAPGGGDVRVFDPTHPDADAQGYVAYPNVDVAAELTDIMGAARAYQVNATVAAAAKQTALDALEIGR